MKLEKKQKIYNFLIAWAAFCPDFPKNFISLESVQGVSGRGSIYNPG